MRTIRIFTDGACSGNPGPGGWAAIISIGDKHKVLSGGEATTTNNRMELLAVVEALARIVKHRSQDTEYEIYSDSAYVVNAITLCWLVAWKMQKWKTTKGEPVKNTDLWQRCDELLTAARKKGKQIKFVKVKGHAGNPLNEYADKVAREESIKARDNGNGVQ